MQIPIGAEQEIAIQQAMRSGIIFSEIDALEMGLVKIRERILETRNFSNSLSKAAQEIRDIRSGTFLPASMTIKDLIRAGRAGDE